MALKKQERRQKMLEIASSLFIEHGYERTSMDEINHRVGCSKTTLYKYYPSKEELFIESIKYALGEQGVVAINSLNNLQIGNGNFWQALTDCSIYYLRIHLSPMVINIIRMVYNEAERVGIGAFIYQRSIDDGCWGKIANYLQCLMEEGKIRKSSPLKTALLLKGMLDAGMLDKRLNGAVTHIPDEEIIEHVEFVMDNFRRAYQIENPII